MKRKKTSKSGVALCLLALVLWCVCTLTAQRAGAYAPGVSVRWTGEKAGVSPAQIQRAERYAEEDGSENRPASVLWRENPAQNLSRPDRPASASANVTEVYGQAELLYPLGFVSGGWPVQGDMTGCAVDEDTALLLWGSTDVLGMPLRWNDQDYLVRGVFRGKESLVVVQGAEDSETPYPGLILSFPAGGGREAAESYLSRNGMESGSLLDLGFLAWSLSALSALPGLLLALGILLRLFRRGWSLRSAPLLLAQYLLPALLGGGAVLWASGFPWTLPNRLIPTRWSDFEFWPRLVEVFGETVRAQLARTPALWDLTLWGPVLLCLALVLGACALMVFAAERARAPTGRAWFLGSLTALGALYALALLLAPWGGVSLTRGMWTLPLLWLACDCCLARHSVFLLPQEGRNLNEVEDRSANARPLPAGEGAETPQNALQAETNSD